MFGEYAQIATYLQQTRDGNSSVQDILPTYLCPPYNPPQPWIQDKKKNSIEDFIMIAEFSELEGPKPVMTIPKDGGSQFDQNSFAVKMLAVDHQKTTDGFTITEDAQIVFSDHELGVYAFVHHLVLYDNTARGFVRPYCIAYITAESRKLIYFYEEISLQFKKTARYLKYGNKMLFVGDLERHLKDLEHTKGYLLNQVSKMRLKDDSNDVNDARKFAENEMYRTLQTIRQSSTEIKEILSILKPLLTDKRLESIFRDLEDKAFQQQMQTGEDKYSLQENWFNDMSLLGEPDLRCGSLNEPKASPLTLFKPRDYKPLLVETKKAKRFNAPLRGLHELCSWGARQGLKKLRHIHQNFKKELMILELERNESRLLYPRCSSLSHGHCVTGNFLSDVYLKNYQNTFDKELEGWSIYHGPEWGSSESLESVDSFKSADEGSPISLNTFNSAQSAQSSPVKDICLPTDNDDYYDSELKPDPEDKKHTSNFISVLSNLPIKISLQSNMSILSICKSSDFDATDSELIAEDKSEQLYSVGSNVKETGKSPGVVKSAENEAGCQENVNVAEYDNLDASSDNILTVANRDHISDNSSTHQSLCSFNSDTNSINCHESGASCSCEESVILRDKSDMPSDVQEPKRDSKSKLSSLLNDNNTAVRTEHPTLKLESLAFEDFSMGPPTPSSEIYHTPSECCFMKSPSGQYLSEQNSLGHDIILKSSVEENDFLRFRAESDTSSAFTEISIRDFFSYDVTSDLHKNKHFQNGKDSLDGGKEKQLYEDFDYPPTSSNLWKPRCRLYTVGDWITNTGYGKPGSCILEMFSSYQNLHHIVFSLLIGRPVLIGASSKFELEVIKLVKALSLFVPATKRRRRPILEWTTKPLSIVDLTKLKLIGVCRPEKRTLDSFIPCAIKKACSIIDIEKRTIIAVPYQGNFITTLMVKRKIFKTDIQYLSFIKWWLMEITAKSFIFFHSFCLSSAGSILYSQSPRDQRNSYCSTVSAIMTKLNIKDGDCDIVQYCTELVKLAKIESKVWYGTDLGSVVYPIHLQHKVCQIFRC